MGMASEKTTIKEVVSWVKDFFANGEINFHDIIVNEHQFGAKLSLSLFTKLHKYNLLITDGDPAWGYLGCIMSNRAPYSGETHTRGSDLPDGPLTLATWTSIMDAIINMERDTSGPRQLLFEDIMDRYEAYPDFPEQCKE